MRPRLDSARAGACVREPEKPFGDVRVAGVLERRDDLRERLSGQDSGRVEDGRKVSEVAHHELRRGTTFPERQAYVPVEARVLDVDAGFAPAHRTKPQQDLSDEGGEPALGAGTVEARRRLGVCRVVEFFEQRK